MKSNLKQQVADLQKELQELTKRFGTLHDRTENYLVSRLQKMDKELVYLRDKFWQDPSLSLIIGLEKRIKQLEDDSK